MSNAGVLKYRVRLTGLPGIPLLMSNAQMADPSNEYAREHKRITSKQKMTDADHEAKAEVEFLGGLYYDPDLGPYLPGDNFRACLVEAAKRVRLGTKVESGVIVVNNAALEYDGPRDITDLVSDPAFRDFRSVRRKKTTRVMYTRPRFFNWAAEYEVMVYDDLLNDDQFRQVVELACRTGVGDYRPVMGRFDAEVEKI